jgi:hypothetical protein
LSFCSPRYTKCSKRCGRAAKQIGKLHLSVLFMGLSKPPVLFVESPDRKGMA